MANFITNLESISPEWLSTVLNKQAVTHVEIETQELNTAHAGRLHVRYKNASKSERFFLRLVVATVRYLFISTLLPGRLNFPLCTATMPGLPMKLVNPICYLTTFLRHITICSNRFLQCQRQLIN